MATPLERDVAAAEARGDLDRVDELNARKLADLCDRADGNGHVPPPEPPPGVPPHDPETYAANSRAVERARKERLRDLTDRMSPSGLYRA